MFTADHDEGFVEIVEFEMTSVDEDPLDLGVGIYELNRGGSGHARRFVFVSASAREYSLDARQRFAEDEI